MIAPFTPDKPREFDPTYRLDEQIAEARREMGEARWAQLNAEWEAPEPPRHGRNGHRLWQQEVR